MLPALGYGTWQLDDAGAEVAVAQAIDQGYRLIDTAQRYHNEYGVGRGLRGHQDVWVTSKVRGGDQGYEQTLRAFQASRRNLGVDRIDLYFIHWPLPRLDLYVETFRALQRLRDDGFIGTLGVCNFEAEQLRRLQAERGELPAVNQVELHLGFRQEKLVHECRDLGVVVQAWGPLGRGRGLLDNPLVCEIAAAHQVSPAQVALAWIRQRGIAAVAKSANPQRMRDNLDSLELRLTDADMESLQNVPQQRIGKDPMQHEEF